MKKRLEDHTKRYRCSNDEEHDVSFKSEVKVLSADGNYNRDDPFHLYNLAHLLYQKQGGSDADFFNFFYQQQQTAADTQTQINKLLTTGTN